MHLTTYITVYDLIWSGCPVLALLWKRFLLHFAKNTCRTFLLGLGAWSVVHSINHFFLHQLVHISVVKMTQSTVPNCRQCSTVSCWNLSILFGTDSTLYKRRQELVQISLRQEEERLLRQIQIVKTFAVPILMYLVGLVCMYKDIILWSKHNPLQFHLERKGSSKMICPHKQRGKRRSKLEHHT